MIASKTLIGLATVQAVSAHFGLVFPTWRADTLSEENEDRYSQWTYPCAGVDYNKKNLTDWPLEGGSLTLDLHHEWSYVFVNLGLGENTTNNQHHLPTASSNTLHSHKQPALSTLFKMQFSTFTAVFAMAAAAIAAPADIEARTGHDNGNNKPVCSAQSKQVCCNGILSCAVQVLGSNCKSDAFCCKTDAPTGALINIALLNCVDIL